MSCIERSGIVGSSQRKYKRAREETINVFSKRVRTALVHKKSCIAMPQPEKVLSEARFNGR